MAAGIYKLVFSDGSFYIGKSSDIEKRWKQHNKAFLKRTHTKNMQEAYDRCGPPLYTIIVECHQDHLDILENYYIGLNWNSPVILNSTKPIWYNDDELNILTNYNKDVWNMSTFSHLMEWGEALDKIDELEEYIESSKDIQYMVNLEQKYEKIKSRGLIARILNRD